MSEVNADGVLLNPHESILQEVQALTNALTAERPEGLEEDMAAPVTAGDGQPAGAAGGAPHYAGGRRPGRPGPPGGRHRQLRRPAPPGAGKEAGQTGQKPEKRGGNRPAKRRNTPSVSLRLTAPPSGGAKTERRF